MVCQGFHHQHSVLMKAARTTESAFRAQEPWNMKSVFLVNTKTFSHEDRHSENNMLRSPYCREHTCLELRGTME